MKTTFQRTVLSLAASAGLASADVEVVFEHLANKENPLPILKLQTDQNPDLETWDGTWTMDSYGGLERYDADRLLLGIRENGINETDPNHDADLAAQYPDRSLIWIDPNTGAPMGVALNVGHTPIEVDPAFTAAGGSTTEYYLTFAVDDSGVIYVNYRNRIARYAPDGNGGFEAPTIAYTQENDGSENWNSWRYETLRARGSGADTVLIAGGKTWRPSQGYRELVTTDGLTFTATEDGVTGFKGGGSSIVPAPAGATSTQEYMYGSLYPGGSNGKDTSLLRNVRDRAKDEPFGGSEYRIQIDEEIGYTASFVTDADVHPDFPYVVSYSTPSWNSAAVGVDPPAPGWIAVHDQFYDPEAVDVETGEGLAELVGLHKIDITEADELVGGSALWHGTLGKVNINVLPGMRPGQAELLWHSGAYGYGRYILDFAPKPIVVTDIQRTSNEEASLTWESETGKFYQIQTSSDLTSDSWQTVANSIVGSDDGVTTATFAIDPAQGQTFARIGLGNIFSEDFESGAEGWTLATLDDPFPDSGNTQWELGTPSTVGPAAAHSGDNVYGTNLAANYGTLGNLTLTSPVIDLTNVERGSLKLWHYIEASDQEGGQIRILNEAGDEVLGFSEVFNGLSTDWEELSLSLLRFGDTSANVVGQKIRIEFRFLSDDIDADDGAGWYIDDLIIE